MLCVDYLRNKISELYYSMFYNMCREENIRHWNVCDIFTQGPNVNKYVVMILNRPLPNDFKQNFILDLWQKG